MGICCISICGAICFNSALSRTLEITLIVLDSIAFVLYFLCLVIIKWKELSKINVVFFVFMFLMVVACLVFSILIRLWRSKNLIKTLKKNVGGNLALSGFIIVIVHFVLCLIEEIVFTMGVIDANHPCLDLDNNTYNPLYIYGGSGLGKTRICNIIRGICFSLFYIFLYGNSFNIRYDYMEYFKK